MHYIEVYFCQQSEFSDSADSSITYKNKGSVISKSNRIFIEKTLMADFLLEFCIYFHIKMST